MSPADVEKQILALLDGELSAEEVASLESTLRSDRKALQAYAKLVDLHNALETRYAGAGRKSGASLVPVERVVARQRQRIAKRSLFAAAAILLGLAVTMAIILTPSNPRQVASFKTGPDARYWLGYEGEGDGPEDGRLAVGSRLVLSDGAFEGVFGSGVRLVAEAPCDLRILAEDRIAVENGVAWFLVPAAAQGFVAETPRLVVKDLGTEFGVISRRGDADEVHVMKGSVEVTARSAGALATTLQAGMAVQVGADGNFATIDPDSSNFRKHLQSFEGTLSHFSFTGPPWSTDKVADFASFAASTPSVDADRFSTTSILSNHGFTPGGYDSFVIRDSDLGTSIFSTSRTPGVGMNLAGADQDVPTHYISFTVTPEKGFRTTFRSFSFYTGLNGANDSYTVELRAWDGSGETQLGSISHSTGGSMNEPVASKVIDFEDFTSDRKVEFRLYGYGVTQPLAAPANSGIRFDDLTLVGSSVAIPLGADPSR